jgi:predicted GH43/DUF377 family glycosyl hydrolase
VLKDGSVWKMWYTGDDSSKKRIAYATSPDGVTWAKGGKVIAPEDPGVSANIAFGAFAPTVWKTGSTYNMLLTGRKIVSGSVFQTKIMETTSSDGIVWAGPSPALNPSGTNSNFDYSNLNAPDILSDPGSPTPYKLYYSGNTIDANGNFHTRIGLATSTNGTSFNKVNGAQTGGSVLDVGTLGTAFDARQASGLSVAATGGSGAKYAGFYWGARGSDFKPRLGEATSSDGSAWTKVTGPAEGGSVLALPNGNAFDKGGQRDPSVLHDGTAYDLYFTALDSGGVRSIGFASTTQVAGTLLPDNTAWANKAQVPVASGSAFDASAVSHPSVIKDGSNYVMYYTGTDAGGTSRIGRATSSSPGTGYTAGATAVLDLGAVGSFDSDGVKDPVVAKLGATDYRMLYTGVDADGIERVGYATSSDGVSWTKQGVVLNPSLAAYSADETGVEPTGLLVDGSTLHVWTSGADRTGRTRGEHATTAYPTPVTPQPGIPSGWASYQLGSASTPIQDFRQIARTSSGSTVALRMSFLQPYSSGGSEYWSDYFPVTASSPSEGLNFLLTVHGVRWRAQLSTPASAPTLDHVDITHAPVSFAPSGSAIAGPIAAAPGRIVSAWGSLVVHSSLFSPGGGGTGAGTVRVLDATTMQQLATAPLNTGGDTTLNLASVPAASHQALRVAFDLTSTGQATPLVQSLRVTYTTQPMPPMLTLAAPLKVVFGKSVALTGSLTKDSIGVGDATIVLSAEPAGATTFAPVTNAATNSTGDYVAMVKPSRTTTYKASYTGVTVEPTVKVGVAFRVTLSVKRKGAKVLIRGKVAPSQRRKLVVIQIRVGSHWKTFAKVRTTRRSTFSTLRKLKRGKHKFRAKKAADAQHLAGMSRVVLLRR